MPHPPTLRELEDEKKDFFPTSEELKVCGKPCFSPVCSTPDSAYASPIIAPFGSPPAHPVPTPPSSRATSVRGAKLHATILGHVRKVDTDAASIDSGESSSSLATHVDGPRPGRQTKSKQSQIIAI